MGPRFRVMRASRVGDDETELTDYLTELRSGSAEARAVAALLPSVLGADAAAGALRELIADDNEALHEVFRVAAIRVLGDQMMRGAPAEPWLDLLEPCLDRAVGPLLNEAAFWYGRSGGDPGRVLSSAQQLADSGDEGCFRVAGSATRYGPLRELLERGVKEPAIRDLALPALIMAGWEEFSDEFAMLFRRAFEEKAACDREAMELLEILLVTQSPACAELVRFATSYENLVFATSARWLVRKVAEHDPWARERLAELPEAQRAEQWSIREIWHVGDLATEFVGFCGQAPEADG